MPKVEWISKKEAIELLEVSEKTLQRRVKAKQYRYRYVKGAHGAELRLRKEDVFKDVPGSATLDKQDVNQDKSDKKEDDLRHTHDEDMASPQPMERSALRVLLVDESEKAIDFLSKLLRKAEVISARDGETGLKLMEETQPDLVILETAIPKIDGFELINTKEDNEKIKDIPIIFYSYLLREHSFVEEARNYPNVVGCFKKPLAGKQLAELKELIKDMMK